MVMVQSYVYAKTAYEWWDYKCSPYIVRRYKVLVKIMLDDVTVLIFRGIGLIVHCLMGRKQLWCVCVCDVCTVYMYVGCVHMYVKQMCDDGRWVMICCVLRYMCHVVGYICTCVRCLSLHQSCKL